MAIAVDCVKAVDDRSPLTINGWQCKVYSLTDSFLQSSIIVSKVSFLQRHFQDLRPCYPVVPEAIHKGRFKALEGRWVSPKSRSRVPYRDKGVAGRYER